MTQTNEPQNGVAVVATGTANLASVTAALRRVGAEVQLVDDAAAVLQARRLVLPGVGAFDAAMQQLADKGLVAPLQQRIREGRPTLAICLGLQLLASTSEESQGGRGLCVFEEPVVRLPDNVVTPELGWNGVVAEDGCRLLEDGTAYFAHSYALRDVPQGWSGTWTQHGNRFVSAIEKGAVLACQFHPELSGAWGERLLRRWFEGCRSVDGERAGSTSAPALARRVVPCLDVAEGRVVKGIQFQSLRDAGDPAERASLYAQQGADEVVILDVSATPEGRKTAATTVARVRSQLNIPLTVGGGIRSVDDASRLLDAGADKVAVNTAAVARPQLLEELAARFGRQCIVLSLDAKRRRGGGWDVVVRSGTQSAALDAVGWAQEAARRGAGEILLTSFDKDGTRSGYDVDLLRAVSDAVSIPVVASGGAATPADLVDAFQAGADAALAASLFHDDDFTVQDVKFELARQGVCVRIAEGAAS